MFLLKRKKKRLRRGIFPFFDEVHLQYLDMWCLFQKVFNCKMELVQQKVYKAR